MSNLTEATTIVQKTEMPAEEREAFNLGYDIALKYFLPDPTLEVIDASAEEIVDELRQENPGATEGQLAAVLSYAADKLQIDLEELNHVVSQLEDLILQVEDAAEQLDQD